MDLYVILLLAVAALAVWVARGSSRIERLEEKLRQSRLELTRATERLRDLASEVKTLRETFAKLETAPPAQSTPPLVEEAPKVEPVPRAPIPRFEEKPAETAAVTPSRPEVKVPRGEPREALPERIPASPRIPPPVSRPSRTAIPAKPKFDWEALIGVKLFSWIAGIALVLAAVFFLKYSVDHGWLSPPIRMAIGLVTGAALLVLCEWKAARRYAVTANALDAAGIAILFSTFFAAHALWDLIGTLPTFAAMAMVTAVVVLLSIRRDSMFIALLGLVGGFATPILLSTGEDRPIGLFSYLVLLDAGLAWVAYRKRWPYLTVLSALFTTIYQWGWVMKFLYAGHIPLAIGIFLIFPILSFAAHLFGEKDSADGQSVLFRQTSAMNVALPLLFALYMAAVPAYGGRYWLLFGFLFLVDAGLAAIAAKRGPELLHAAAGISTVVTFCIWLQASYMSAAWPAILPISAGFVLLYLGAAYWIRFKDGGVRGVFAAPLLFVVFPALAAIEPATVSPGPLFAVLFTLMIVLAAYAVLREDGGVHYLAAFFALAAEAVWSARYLNAGRLMTALSMYAVFGLFYLGVPLLARRWNKHLGREGSGAIVLFASLALLFFLATGPVASSALWGIALLLMILNLGLLLEASSGRRPMVLFAGILLSWIVLAVWWSTVPIVSLLVPGLVVVGGFAVMILCGSIWAARRAEFDGGLASPAFDRSLYLALIGHAFLFFVVLQKPLAIPPWPFLGVLAVLDLAIGVAALYSRRGELHLGALASSQIILIVWQFTVQEAPWPSIAVFCALGAAALGFIWFMLARKLNLTGATPGGIFFGVAAIASCQLGIAVVVAATIVLGVPGVTLLAAAAVVFSSLTLAIDWLTDFHFLAPVSVLSSAFALWMWSNAHFKSENWMEEFLFAASIYSLFLAYPVLMGSRARTLLQPYLAAVIASGTFFLFARHSLLAGGFAYAIGLLPVTQAALMAGLLWRLLRLETPGNRSLGRLALVAGAVLALVTVAIPLQFEKQWITIGWALQAAALAWLWRKIPHDGIVIWIAGLLIAVFSRLIFNPDVFSYYPRSTIPILNWYLYTYLISAAAFLAVGWLLRHQSKSIWNGLPRLSAIAAAGGAVLLFALLNIEIADYYSKGTDLTFNFGADLGQDLTYTIGWGVFAFGLLIAGIVLRTKAARVSAIALLSVTVAKCFLHDLWRLGGLYRIGSFVGLAVCLTMVTLLLQRFVLRPESEVK